MGGKSKQSQRTKNNARPSSSGRSAELLNNVIHTDSMFGALSTGKMVPALFPTLSPSTDNILSNEFILAFKKLNKKDPITRTKALQELLELIHKSDIEEVVAALPNWTVFYLMLTVDNDRKVRELTQACNGAIFSRSGRRAAPHVRRLLPVWLLAVHDDYGPSRHTASTHLHSTFPGQKLSEAIAFCKSEIIALIMDNLTGNPEAVLNKKIEAADERQAAAARVRAGSLGALGLLLQLLPLHFDLAESLQPLLAAASFWKLHAHDDHHVRAAWFEAVGRLIEREGGRLGEVMGGRMSAAILAQPENRPDVAAARWAALLMLLRVEDWQRWVKKKDLLIKRLLDTIENGAWGDASLSSAILLPLLAQLPEAWASRELHRDVLQALLSGLEQKSILNSKSERQIWITSLADCLRYISTQKHDYVIEVVSSAHRTWLEKIFSVPDHTARSHLVKFSAGKMASLVKYWIKQSIATRDDVYDKLIRNLWQNFGATVVAQIDAVSTNDEDIAALLHLHTITFEALSSGEAASKKALRFDDEPASDGDVAAREEEAVEERFGHGVTELVSAGCCAWLDVAESRGLRAVLPPLAAGLQRLGSAALFGQVARAKVGGGPFALYERLWRGWLRGDALRCRALVQVLFLAAAHFSDAELRLMYDSFDGMPPVVVEWAMSASLGVRRAAASDWLRGSLVASTLVSLSRRRHADADRLVLDCLTPRDGELRVSEEAVGGVVRALSEAPLRRPAAAALCRTLAASRRASDALPLAELLFDCSLETVRDGDATQGDEGEDNEERGEDEGWRHLCGPRLAAHAQRRLHALLLASDESLDVVQIERWASLCAPLLAAGEFAETAKGLLSVESSSAARAFALRKDCVDGRLLCPVADEQAEALLEIVERDDEGDLEASEVAPFARVLAFRAALLRLMLRAKGEADIGPYPRDVFVAILHDAAVVGSLCEGYAHAPFYNILERCKDFVDAAIDEVISLLPEEDAKEVAASLTRRAFDVGYYWAFARALYLSKAQKRVGEGVAEESVAEADDGPVLEPLLLDKIVTRSGFFHMAQVQGGLRGRYLSAIRGWYLAQGFESADEQRKELFASKLRLALPSLSLVPLMDDYYKYRDNTFNDRDYWTVPWSVASCESGVLQLLREAVEAGAWELDAATWDFVNIALCSALASLARTPGERLRCSRVAAVGRAALGLFASVVDFVGKIRGESERRTPSAHVASLPAEWCDVFAPTANTDLLTLHGRLLERGRAGRYPPQPEAALMDAAAAALPFVFWEKAAAARRATDLSLQRLTCAALDALSLDLSAPAHRLAYAALDMLAEPLVLEDVTKLKSASEDDDTKVSLSLQLHLAALKRSAGALLPDDKHPDDEPPADWRRSSRGFLLTALAVLRHADLASRLLVHHYMECLRESEVFGAVVTVAMWALPAEVRRATAVEGGALSPRLAEYFACDPPLGPDDALGRVACRVLTRAARGAGAAVRAHWSACSPRSADALRRVVALGVTPLLLDEQLRHLKEHRARELDGVEVTVSRAGGQCEVRARALVDECWTELTLTLGGAYPLEPPRLQEAPAASQLHWVRMYLAYENGRLLTALRLWSQALRCRADCAAQCFICYCRLHPATARLPSVPCHTCGNRFHSACLRKWFKTSKKANCPLCRTVF